MEASRFNSAGAAGGNNRFGMTALGVGAVAVSVPVAAKIEDANKRSV